MIVHGKRAYSDEPGHILLYAGGQEIGLSTEAARRICEDLQEAVEESSKDWTDCGNVQCKQAHESLNAVLQMLDVKCSDQTYIVGKAAGIALAINALKEKAGTP